MPGLSREASLLLLGMVLSIPGCILIAILGQWYRDRITREFRERRDRR